MGGGENPFPRMQFFAHDPLGLSFTAEIAVITNDEYASTGMQLFLVPPTTLPNYRSGDSTSPNQRAYHRRPLHDSEHAE